MTLADSMFTESHGRDASQASNPPPGDLMWFCVVFRSGNVSEERKEMDVLVQFDGARAQPGPGLTCPEAKAHPRLAL